MGEVKNTPPDLILYLPRVGYLQELVTGGGDTRAIGPSYASSRWRDAGMDKLRHVIGYML